REKSERVVEELRVVEADGRRGREVGEGAQRGEVFARATAYARDLINAPANELSPSDLARAAAQVAKEHRLAIQVYERADCRRLPVEVHGLIAATENMPSGTALRPGDILRSMSGTTIEVGNTDAEGRLTLADALAYAAARVKPDEVIDVATLTGACVVALGPLCAGLMSNDAGLANRLLEAAGTAGEGLWQLP